MTHTKHVSNGLAQWWENLENGWEAVLLGFLALTLVYLGIPIPW
ncbi:hypothetical protein [Haladaptatus halobius]|nr:hypothetical protein [Haladaptatus halobius]